jgi:cytochrome c peroxidase
MRKYFLIVPGLLVAGYSWFSCTQPATPPEKLIAQKLSTQVDSFALICKALKSAVDSPSGEAVNRSPGPAAASSFTRAQELFLRARLAYKRFEWAAEYFDPTAALAVNGPPVREVEKSGLTIDPTGLQMIEAELFPTVDPSKKQDIRHQADILLGACERYKSHFANIDILDWQVFDAAKLEVFRVMTLGITGFDNPLTLHSTAESAAALQSLKDVLAHYNTPPEKEITAAVQYLSTHPDFNEFNRAVFITTYANPLSTAISDQESALNIHVIRYNRLLNQDAKTLFDTAAFNINAYTHDKEYFSTPAKVALGQKLFTDPSLSSTGTRSCQSCHQPDKAFADGLVKNTILGATDMLPRNTPTLINAALQPAQFYDLRVTTLEEQSRTVVQNDAEMHGDMKLSVPRLWQDTTYRRMFTEAFPRNNRTGIDTLEIMNAIGSYVRSLVALDSRFDEYMRGDHSALSQNEINGFNLFMGQARCGTCHYMPIFNGAFPPRFVKMDAEIIGVPQTAAALTGSRRSPGSSAGEVHIDPDPGRFAIIPDSSFNHAFKTPTVRNATRTAPYMHNGVFSTLEEVVDFYDKGGGAGLGLKVSNQTLPFDKLGLTPQQKSDLIAFMKSLDSR